jgi:hypothetical protein
MLKLHVIIHTKNFENNSEEKAVKTYSANLSHKSVKKAWTLTIKIMDFFTILKIHFLSRYQLDINFRKVNTIRFSRID